MEINFREFNRKMRELIASGDRLTVGIDGQSFSGKTTLAKYMTERFPGFVRISLDGYMTSGDVRMGSFRDKERRNTMFERWYDEGKLAALNLPKDGHAVIEGTFLLVALPKEKFDIIFIVTRNAMKEERIKRILEKNSLLSTEEAEAMTGAYEEAWCAYERSHGLRSDNRTIYIKMR